MRIDSGDDTKGFVYVAAFTPEEAEVAALELTCMAGAAMDGRLAEARVGCDVSPAAYTRVCVEVLARGEGLEEVVGAVEELGLDADGFAIEVLSVPPRPNFSTRQAAVALADRIRGRPNLSQPRVRFALVAREGLWLFGRVVSRARRDWHDPAQRPHHFSIALPVRLARALVNMVAAPGDTLLDPACGLGTVLIEAERVGAVVQGFDINPKHVAMARDNLEQVGCCARVEVADARALRGQWDAAVIDLPYGHSSIADDQLYADMVGNVARCVGRMVVVTGEDRTELWRGLGLRVLGLARVAGAGVVRHVHLLATDVGR